MKRDRILQLHERLTDLKYGKYAHCKLMRTLVKARMRLAERRLVACMENEVADGELPLPLTDEGQPIVSLTTFPARIGKVWIVVDSLMRQSFRPAAIWLWLSDEDFPNGLNSLPERLLAYIPLGLHISFRPDNLMPHKKYFYALSEMPDRDIITVDDDMYYRPDLIATLMDLHAKYPGCICANTIRTIALSDDGKVLPYSKWTKQKTGCGAPSLMNVAIGCNGVLYPAWCLRGNAVFNVGDLKFLSLRADDLWLKAHELMAGIKVASGEGYHSGPAIPGAEAFSLQRTNRRGTGNDLQWQRLTEYYNIEI